MHLALAEASAWAKFRALRISERRTFLLALFCLPIVWVALRAIGLRRLQTFLLRLPAPGANACTRDEALRIATLVGIAARRVPFPTTCLTRAMLLGWMLRRTGSMCELRIGVRLQEGALSAHAWIEYQGAPLNERADIGEQFLPFADILPPGAFAPK